MTRRTFIAFLTALLPANWLRPTVEPPKIKPLKPRASGSSEDTARMCGAFDGRLTPPRNIVVLKARQSGFSDAHREWMRHYGGNLRAFYAEPPVVTVYPSHGPGLCDLAYRKP